MINHKQALYYAIHKHTQKRNRKQVKEVREMKEEWAFVCSITLPCMPLHNIDKKKYE